MSSSLGDRTLAGGSGQVNFTWQQQQQELKDLDNDNNADNDDDLLLLQANNNSKGRQLNLKAAGSCDLTAPLELKRQPTQSLTCDVVVSSSPFVKSSNNFSNDDHRPDEKLHFLSNYSTPQQISQQVPISSSNSNKEQKLRQKVLLAKQEESILLDYKDQELLFELKQFEQEKEKLALVEREQKERIKAAEASAPPTPPTQECHLFGWCKMSLACWYNSCARKCLLISLLVLIIYSMAIYCLPFVTIEPSIPPALPVVPFDFLTGPLKPTTAAAYQAEHLFRNQLYGPESLAFDSLGNAYLAIEGGFILYAHLNLTSPIRRPLLEAAGLPVPASTLNSRPSTSGSEFMLIKIAELNGPRAGSNGVGGQSSRRARETHDTHKRECQLDEQVYGPHLYTTTTTTKGSDKSETGSEAEVNKTTARHYFFKSNVRVSRCSKPLGIRLSQDEQFLYVIDTLNGLYRINLRLAGDKLTGFQRQVSKLIDFKANNGQQTLAAVQLDQPMVQLASNNLSDVTTNTKQQLRISRTMNVSLKALDDLVIDHKAGATGGDLIYMTVASQVWPATSFVFDVLEGRPSGLVLRLDTATQQLVVLEPARVAHVRSSSLTNYYYNLPKHSHAGSHNETMSLRADEISDINMASSRGVDLGAPKLDENDQFDDRPLNFPNGLELMDDRQALLIADTSNKRILKHYLRGPRAGTTDLWAWTPHFPDNIRRGYARHDETYWVVGCGKSPTNSGTNSGNNNNLGGNNAGRTGRQQLAELNQKLSSWDPLVMLRNWPRVRKFLLKNIYFVGAAIEFVGANVLRSTSVQDMGYELRTGSSLCSSGCSGMMILQYNSRGDIIRSIHSREFPTDLMYYSQVNELIDAQNGQHVLYLGSPSYSYLTKLVLPTELRSTGPT